MVKIFWTRWSIKDLRSIYDYIALDSPFYASRFIDKLINRTEQLIEHPQSGRIVPEKEDPNIKELIEGNYRIFYKINPNKVTILRIHNSARKIK